MRRNALFNPNREFLQGTALTLTALSPFAGKTSLTQVRLSLLYPYRIAPLAAGGLIVVHQHARKPGPRDHRTARCTDHQKAIAMPNTSSSTETGIPASKHFPLSVSWR